MTDKLQVTPDTAIGDANGIAKVLGQIVKHYPYLLEGQTGGQFNSLPPYTVKRLKKVVDDRAAIEAHVAKLLDLAEQIVEANTVDA